MLNNSKVIEILKEHELDPTEDNLLYILERIHYFEAFVLFDFMEYNEFCEILEVNNNFS